MAFYRTLSATGDDVANLADNAGGSRTDDGRYDVAEEFARGGLGRIFEAHDQKLDRRVAVKELIASNATLRDRFRREVAITARLQHPSIVPVYDAGVRANGEPYYVMKLLRGGRTLKDVVTDAADLNARLALLPNVIAVADAVAYAHSVGIIHRDLKPSNVVVGPFGETVVIDWGLAKDLSRSEPSGELNDGPFRMAAGDVTGVGAVVGTPQFMAPEQARGEPVDERADVYSLGALLYYVLAGSPPHEGTTDEILARLKQQPPQPLGERQSGIPADLIAIVDKALAQRADERYSGAQSFVDDLRRFQTGQLVAAHRYSRRQLLARWVARHRTAVILSALFTVALVASGSVAMRQVVQARDRAEARGNRLLLGQSKSMLATDPTSALALLKLYPNNGGDLDLAHAIASDAQSRGVARHVLEGHRRNVHRMAFSSDGALLATVSFDTTLRLWDAATARTRSIVETPSELFAVRFSDDDRLVAFSGEGGTVRVLDVRSGAVAKLQQTNTTVYGLAFHDGGRRLLAWGVDHQLFDWELATGHVVRRAPVGWATASPGQRYLAEVTLAGDVVVEELQTGVRTTLGRHVGGGELAWSGDETRFASVASDGIVVWDRASGRSHRFGGISPIDWVVGLSHDGRVLAAVDTAHVIHVWNVDDGKTRTLPWSGSEPFALAFSPVSLQLGVGDTSGRVALYDLERGGKRDYLGHSSAIHQLVFTRDGATLATASGDRTVRLWDASPSPAVVLRAHQATLSAAAHAPDSTRFATGSADGVIIVWDAATNRPILRAPSHEREVSDLAFSSDGRQLASGGWDRTARVVDLATQKALRFAGSAIVNRVVFVAGDAQIAFAGTDGTVWLGDVRSGAQRVLYRHEGSADALVAAKKQPMIASGGVDGTVRVDYLDGRPPIVLRHPAAVTKIALVGSNRLISTSIDGGVRSWELPSGQMRLLRQSHDPVQTLAVSADGSAIATSGQDGDVWITRASDGSSERLRGHDGEIVALSFSNDGTVLASSARDATTRLWNRSNGATAVLRSDGAEITSLSFSPDGERLLLGDSDCVVRVWPRRSIPFAAAGTGGAELHRWLDQETDLSMTALAPGVN